MTVIISGIAGFLIGVLMFSHSMRTYFKTNVDTVHPLKIGIRKYFISSAPNEKAERRKHNMRHQLNIEI